LYNNGFIVSQTHHDKLSSYKPLMTEQCIQANCDTEIEIQTANELIP